MSRYVVSMNLGGTFIPKNVQESHLDSANRWGAEYIQISGPLGESCKSPFGIKMEMFRIGFEPHDHIVWIDGDAVIRSDCPSLFDLVPDGSFGAVCNAQDERQDENLQTIAGLARDWVPSMQCDQSDYFNGGAMVFSGKHLIALAAAFSMSQLICEVHAGKAIGPMAEQTMTNWAVRAMGFPFVMLPASFNRLGVSAWTGKWREDDGTDNYILHLANVPGFDRNTKMDVLSRIEWRVPAEVET